MSAYIPTNLISITDGQIYLSPDLFHSEHIARSGYRPKQVQLLPLDQQWLKKLEQRDWPTRQLPMFTMDSDQLFSALVRQYLFVVLYRAFAESLASENASRLASMWNSDSRVAFGPGGPNNRRWGRRTPFCLNKTAVTLCVVRSNPTWRRPDRHTTTSCHPVVAPEPVADIEEAGRQGCLRAARVVLEWHSRPHRHVCHKPHSRAYGTLMTRRDVS